MKQLWIKSFEWAGATFGVTGIVVAIAVAIAIVFGYLANLVRLGFLIPDVILNPTVTDNLVLLVLRILGLLIGVLGGVMGWVPNP
jgi:cell division protein FtsX